ncbi:MAG: peptidase M50 [Oscillospiraceae bacterium]|jgi:regulator of sigma E protease|nr:peptidase M50 [Oscillospiraceae bacterium]
MYIILAILLFGILIAAHEWGHFIAARLCGVTVHEFSIGMGPLIWKKDGKKGTKFSLRALPIGGFCSLEGEEEESDDPHSLSNQGFWKKVLVFAAGAVMNLLVGMLIILLLNFQATGFYVPAAAGCAPEFETVNGGALLEGDIFYSINGSRVYTPSDIDLLIMVANGQPIDLVVLRDGERVRFDNLAVGTFSDSDGNPYQGYGFYRTAIVREATLGTRLQYTWYNTVDFVRTVWFSLQMLVNGSAGVSDLNGPVGIVSTINDVGNQSASVADALMNIVYFGAFISVNLSVMNLLPIPALDGGHILFLVVSTVSEKLFRRKIPMKYEAAINMVFLALLMGLMLFVTFNDVMRLVGGGTAA